MEDIRNDWIPSRVRLTLRKYKLFSKYTENEVIEVCQALYDQLKEKDLLK